MNIWNLKIDDYWTSTTIPSFARRAVRSLITVLLCRTLKPNSKFSGNFVLLGMGLTNSGKESNFSNVSVFTKVRSPLSCYFIYLYSPVHSLQIKIVLKSE